MAQKKKSSLRVKTDRPLDTTEVKPTSRMLPAMPIRVRYDPLRVVVSLEKQEQDVLFRFRFAEQPKRYEERLFDAYSLRESFLGVRTYGEALELLSLAGHFRHLRERDEAHIYEALTWSEFQKWQELIRIVLSNGPLEMETIESQNVLESRLSVPAHLRLLVNGLSLEEAFWLMGHPHGIEIQSDSLPQKSQQRRALCAEVTVHSMLEAILATVYIDGLSGVHYELCALPDCNNLFEVSSKHERQYCSQPCAHKASVRRRRAEAKAIAEGAKQKAAKKKSMKAKV